VELDSEIQTEAGRLSGVELAAKNVPPSLATRREIALTNWTHNIDFIPPITRGAGPEVIGICAPLAAKKRIRHAAERMRAGKLLDDISIALACSTIGSDALEAAMLLRKAARIVNPQ
jgi:hypothetical protein